VPENPVAGKRGTGGVKLPRSPMSQRICSPASIAATVIGVDMLSEGEAAGI
jgi:hypothetical protein